MSKTQKPTSIVSKKHIKKMTVLTGRLLDAVDFLNRDFNRKNEFSPADLRKVEKLESLVRHAYALADELHFDIGGQEDPFEVRIGVSLQDRY